MPARSERIYVFPDQSGQPGLIMRFPVWWNRSEFFKRYSHREIDLGNPIDANFVFVLTSAEAIAWNKECAEQFSLTSISSKNSVVEDMSQVESVFRNASWVIVESYEWESGLD
jgi:hypothetical protein